MHDGAAFAFKRLDGVVDQVFTRRGQRMRKFHASIPNFVLDLTLFYWHCASLMHLIRKGLT